MSDDELTERVSLALAKRHLRALDEWRRRHPEIPTRAKALRLMIEALTGDVPAPTPAKAPPKGKRG